jgi:VIT1/CCC1 family predicted Fe2+/Mn2+ transporter
MKSVKRVLDPIDRVSEVLFGLIMVLTFTGSLSIAEAGREDIRIMLIAALGCNLAWGIIDGVLYLMGCLAEKSRELLALHAIRRTSEPHKAQQLVLNTLPATIAEVLLPAELDTICQRLRAIPALPERSKLVKDDWWGALGVFLLVFLSTFPVVIPFVFMRDALPALRLSNLIAVVMLFGTGFVFARITGRHPWVMGAVMVALGLILVGITMALGG